VVAAPGYPLASEQQTLTSPRQEQIVMATSVGIQRAEEKPVTITPVANPKERINKMSQAIAQRAYEIFEGNGRKFGRDLDDWFKAEWICFIRFM
jgi:hypothetical protein